MTSSPTRSLWSRLADVVGLVATPLEPSHYLELVNPLWGSHELRARVEAVHDETADARTLTLRPGRGWKPHRAGQHVRVGVELEGRRLTRTFSIASPPERDDGCITITVKLAPGGRVSRFLVRDVVPGAYVALSAPEGEFVLLEGAPPPSLFVTGGSGITPVMSILRSLAARRALPDAVHVHYAHRLADVIFRDELRHLADRFPQYRLHLIETRAPGGSLLRFSPEQLATLCPDHAARTAWACGPEGLLDAVSATVPGARVERFHARFAAAPPGGGGDVRFCRSGKSVRADGKTPLLLVAEGAGVAAPHGCRMGICHSCDATMVRGKVRDLRTGQRIDEPGTRVQVCVCAAEGDVDLEL